MRLLFPALLLTAATAGCSGNTVGQSDASHDHPRDAAADAAPADAFDSSTDDVAPPDDAASPDASDASADAGDGNTRPVITSMGGSVDLLHFAVFGDVRPNIPDNNSDYPVMIITQVMDNIEALGAQFATSSGDYMNENFCASCADAQIDLLQAAEQHYHGHIFHGMGNHECYTVTSINCPNENETVALRTYLHRLIPDYAHPYFDFTVNTSLGAAHFVSVAPNAWNDAQRTWLQGVINQPARYTFLMAHEPPEAAGPGTAEIETIVNARTGGVTLRLYGHSHLYAHDHVNALIAGNAGAPLTDSSNFYGFVMVDQNADGNIGVTAYEIGSPPMVRDLFFLQPDGTAAH